MSEDIENTEDEVIDLEWEETTDEADAGTAQQKMKKMRTELREAKATRDEYLAGWQKAKADYINFKKESDKRISEMKSYVQVDCVQDMFPALDAFEMATKGEAWESVDANWRMGIDYIRQQLEKMITEYGVSEIATANIQFDPAIHEPFESRDVTDESQVDQVLEIIQKGYKTSVYTLRPAKVAVGKLSS